MSMHALDRLKALMNKSVSTDDGGRFLLTEEERSLVRGAAHLAAQIQAHANAHATYEGDDDFCVACAAYLAFEHIANDGVIVLCGGDEVTH